MKLIFKQISFLQNDDAKPFFENITISRRTNFDLF